MKPLAIHALFAITLFSIGMFAGNWVRHNLLTQSVVFQETHSAELMASSEDVLAAARETEQKQLEPELAEQAFLAGLQDIVKSGQAKSVDAAASLKDADEPSDAPSSGLSPSTPLPRRADLSQVIDQLAPDASPDERQVWLEEFAELSAEELVFFLQQRKASGSSSLFAGSKAQILNESSDQPDPLKLVSLTQGSDSVDVNLKASQEFFSIAEQSVRANLLNRSVPGYRAAVTLQSPGWLNAESSGDCIVSDSSNLRQVRQLKRGSLIHSGDPLHVALPDHPGLMFCLADGRLTRRGDFQNTESGLILTGGGNSTQPADTTVSEKAVSENDALRSVVRITSSGEMMSRDSEGKEFSAGRLKIVELRHPQNLKTSDGVFFVMADAEDVLRELSPEEIALTERCFESSNVTASEEWSALESIRKMQHEFLSRTDLRHH
jgi:flagellar basal body rod protein FlgF